MFPILSLGPLVIPVPQISLLLAFWLGLSLAEKTAHKHSLSADLLYNLTFTGLIAGLLGARLGYIFQYPNAFLESPLSLFSLNPGLLDPFSGAATGLIGMAIYGQRAKLTFWKTLDGLTPLLATLMAGQALAHLASGEAYGAPTTLPWAIELWGAKRHPTQFYELGLALLILGFLGWKLKTAPAKEGQLFLLFAALTAGARLFLEAFRGDSLFVAGGFRLAQVLAWIGLTAALWFYQPQKVVHPNEVNQMDKIIVKDLCVTGILGIYAHERITPQEILINLVLFTDIHKAAETDDIAHCLDYEKVANQVRAYVETSRRLTVEALAEDLAQICLAVPGAKQVMVRVEKPQAIAFTGSVGVEIEREKA